MTSEMRWIITHDLIDDVENNSAVGISSQPKPNTEELQYEFQLFDGDGEHYYSGRCDNPGEFDELEAFAPQDWAAGYAGCTVMKYRKFNTHDQWEVL